MSAARGGRAAATVRIRVNGRPRRVTVPPMKRLLDVLRQDLALTGAKEGCGEGECGACSVLLDGRPVTSCLVAAVQCHGAAVTTVEGLAARGALSRLQAAFVEHGAAQCGICTPGMLIAARAWLGSRAPRTEESLREALAGNLCRCTGYQKIVDAVLAVATPPRRARKPAKAGAAGRARAAARSRRPR